MDRTAAPVATDDPLMAKIRPMLAGTTLETEPLRMCYSATEDGWSPGVLRGCAGPSEQGLGAQWMRHGVRCCHAHVAQRRSTRRAPATVRAWCWQGPQAGLCAAATTR